MGLKEPMLTESLDHVGVALIPLGHIEEACEDRPIFSGVVMSSMFSKYGAQMYLLGHAIWLTTMMASVLLPQ